MKSVTHADPNDTGTHTMLLYLLWMLTTLFVVGAIVGYALSIRVRKTDLGATIFGGMMSTVVLMLGFLMAYLAAESSSPTFLLRKDGWRCTAFHEEMTAGVQASSGGTTTVPQMESVCDRYDRIGG